MNTITRATFSHLVESLAIPSSEKAEAIEAFDKAGTPKEQKALYDKMRRGSNRNKSIQTK